MSDRAALLLILVITALLWFAPVPVTPRCDPLMALPWFKCSSLEQPLSERVKGT